MAVHIESSFHAHCNNGISVLATNNKEAQLEIEEGAWRLRGKIEL